MNSMLAAVLGSWEIILILIVIIFPIVAVSFGIAIFLLVRNRAKRKAVIPSTTPLGQPPIAQAAKVTLRRCPQCGAELKPDAPEGLCPACLFKVGQASSL